MLTDTQLEALNSITAYDLTGRLNGLSNEDLTTITPSTLPTLTTVDLSQLTTSAPIQLSSLDHTSFGVLSAVGGVSGTGGSGGAGYTLASGGNGSVNWQSPYYTTSAIGATIGTPMTVNQGGKIELRGDHADIDINGKSMRVWMEQVEQRLNMLTPNPKLEKEWDDLRKLGERYRKLEKKCKEKAEVWKKLKSMPPPKLD